MVLPLRELLILRAQGFLNKPCGPDKTDHPSCNFAILIMQSVGIKQRRKKITD